MILVYACWIVTVVTACVAGALFIVGVMTSEGAMQEVTVTAGAAAMCIIPYVISRSIEGLLRTPSDRHHQKTMLKLIKDGALQKAPKAEQEKELIIERAEPTI